MFLHSYAHDTVFYYVTIKKKIYVEPDHGTASRYINDVVIRVFSDRIDAGRYAETIAHYEIAEPEDVFVVSATLGHLLKIVETQGSKIKEMNGDTLRLDACKMEHDQHPETLTTIYRYSTPQYLN